MSSLVKESVTEEGRITVRVLNLGRGEGRRERWKEKEREEGIKGG